MKRKKRMKMKMRNNKYHLFATSKGTTHAQEVTLLKKILYHYGPFITSVSTGVDFEAISSYRNGIYTFPSSCNPNDTDHAVTIVGYGKENGKEYFMIKNSWYDGWGIDSNYMKVSTNVLCGIGYSRAGYITNNIIVYAGTCKLDKNCETCNEKTLECTKCKEGTTKDNRGMCIDPNDNEASGTTNSIVHVFILLMMMFILI